MMAQFKQEYFHEGTDVQKRPDIVIDLRRIDIRKIKEWTPAQKRNMKKWLKEINHQFEVFIAHLNNV